MTTGPVEPDTRVMRKHTLDEDVWTLAVRRARQLYEMFDHVCVSFSGGKDSTAALHAVLAAAHEKPDERLPLRVIFFDEEVVDPETEAYVRRVSQRDDVALEWYCVPLKHRNAASLHESHWITWDPAMRDKWVRPLPPEAITNAGGYVGGSSLDDLMHHSDVAALLNDPAVYGEAVQVIGIRAAESLTRYRSVAKREKDNWIVQENSKHVSGALWKAYPVYDWSNTDVWTAPAIFNWDYNRNYDLQEMYGLAPRHQRVGTQFGNEAISKIAAWPEMFPDFWERMLDRIPGLATAYRYADTELYAHGEYPVKPVGDTWMEFVISLLDGHGPERRKAHGKVVQEELRGHHTRSGGAILAEKAPHPTTGLSWDYLAMLAQRGDMMGRKAASQRVVSRFDIEGRAKATRRYEDDIARVRAEGRIREIL